MEENERTLTCENERDVEFKDFSDELVDFPHILEYIQNLHKRLESKQNDILDLKTKLTDQEIKQNLSSKKLVNKETQTIRPESEEIPVTRDWINDSNETNTSIADQVAEAAQFATLQTGFVYEKTTGLYYDYNSGYYYDPQSGLYYDGNTGTYFYYDKDSKSYKFHSQIQKESDEKDQSISDTKKTRRKPGRQNKDRIKKVKSTQGEDDIVEAEEGECLNSENEETTSSANDSSASSSDSSDTEKDEVLGREQVVGQFNIWTGSAQPIHEILPNVAKTYPPCMRIIVKETNLPNLRVGTLFIVTCTGGSIGREGDHLVIIRDINVSKHHAKLLYNEVKKMYEIIDLGSRNGTVLNGKRISAAKQESSPTAIVHGSILQLGSTKLLCHIHSGHETCGHCEPGLVQASPIIEESFTSVKKQHQSELKRLKSKFGIEPNIDLASRVALGYQDRAQSRREYVGSSDPHAKTQQSSLDESISKDNMGFKMLSKMGWSEGMSLGKSNEGLTEPVPLSQNADKAGLGTSEEHAPNIEIDPGLEKKQAIWRKTQQRFNDLSD